MDLVVVETPFGAFHAYEDDLVTEHLRDFGGHQRPDLAAMRSLVREGDVVLDIGANIGTFAIPLAASVGPSGRVFGFEASPTNADVLRRNVRSNDLIDRVVVVEGVVSDRAIAYEREEFEGNLAATRFVPSAGAAGGEGPAVVHLDEWAVETLGADTRIDVVKIDVEGMDVDVLRSARSLIARWLPVVSIEVAAHELESRGREPADIGRILEPLGYRLFRNIAERNGAHDDFRIGQLRSVDHGGPFYDLLAIHPDSGRVPADLVPPSEMAQWTKELRSTLRRLRVARLRRAGSRRLAAVLDREKAATAN
ncbi:FkbM family methyltransferase [Actinospongicola halichondriae]|uniref:FkbM family methyltransferase n=1 Tax=Actinospongicola halichondriae TaxID=3236844 RepID=UPI003D5B6AFF